MFSCSGCVAGTCWGVCKLCVQEFALDNICSQKQRFDSLTQVERHCRTRHKQPDNPCAAINTNIDDSDATKHQNAEFLAMETQDHGFAATSQDMSWVFDDEAEENNVDPWADCESQLGWDTPDIMHHSREANLSGFTEAQRLFFQKGDLRKSAACAVARAVLRREFPSEDQHTKDDVTLMIKLTLLLMKLGKSDRALLGDILGEIIKKQKQTRSSGRSSVSVPTAEAAFRNTVLHDGKHSILNSVAIPEFEKIDGHSCCSPVSIVQFLFACGTPVEPIPVDASAQSTVTRCTETLKAQDTAARSVQLAGHNGTVILKCDCWSDDADLTTDVATAGRGKQTWFMTVTISVPREKQNSTDDTFLVAVGNKGGNHDVVRRRFESDIALLNGSVPNCACRTELRRNLQCSMASCSFLMDVPETREVSGTLSFNGRFHPRFGYTSSLLGIRKSSSAEASSAEASKEMAFDRLMPCCKCHDNRVKRIIPPAPCLVCADLDFETANDVLRGPLPNDHPSTNIDTDVVQNGVRPQRTSFSVMAEECRKTARSCQKKEWTDKECRSCLCHHGTSDETACLVIDWVDDCLDRNKSADEMLDGLTDQVLPATWVSGNLTLKDLLDVPVHLLGLGVVRSTTTPIVKWMKARGLNSAFVRSFGDLLSLITESTRLNWLELRGHKEGTMGSWISKNCFGFAAVYKWFFSQLSAAAPDPLLEENDPDVVPIKNWRVRELQNWLKNRDQSSSGRKSESQERVKKLLDNPEGPPKKVGQKGGPVTDAENVVTSLHSMMSLLLQEYTNAEHRKEVERAIKIFLHHVNVSDKLVQPDRKAPLTVSSPNFLLLLNLPEQLRVCGHVRLHWEGCGMGEKILQGIKERFCARTGDWSLAIMRDFHQEKAVRLMLNSLEASNEAPNGQPSPDDCRKFKSFNDAFTAINDGKAIVTGVLLSNNTVGVVVGKLLYPVQFHQELTVSRLSCLFAFVSLHDAPVTCDWEEMVGGTVGMLPDFAPAGGVALTMFNGIERPRHCAFTSIHTERGAATGNFQVFPV